MGTVIITGSSGLIGSTCVEKLCQKFDKVVGIDNDMRKYFFGEKSSTRQTRKRLLDKYLNFLPYELDIRDRQNLDCLFSAYPETEMIIHTAGQPSHDWASREPLTDFDINAVGTINLLESYRKYCPSASFIFTSTNKVYGDNPNKLPVTELETRYDYHKPIDESMSIDNCKHSVFGSSKLSADVMVQEYGKYFNLNTVSFRCGCLTGENHMGAELHGFLSYLTKCVKNNSSYTIYGYQGKQVRDNLHSNDLVNAFLKYHENPKAGEVYNIGGGEKNSISIIEAIKMINDLNKSNWHQFKTVDEPRSGDHIWYITDNSKFMKDYDWRVSISLEGILTKMLKTA